MTIDILAKKDCTGCSLCSTVCHNDSILMEPDKEGYLYPNVDYSTCDDCGGCVHSCPIINIDKNKNKAQNTIRGQKINIDSIEDEGEKKKEETRYPIFYTSAIKDKEHLLKSSSGGIFILLAKHFIENGGYVCGCIFDEIIKAVHVCTNEMEVVNRMRGSKYVQSDLSNCLPSIKELLKGGNKVLFTGVACQVDAVKNYIRKPNENLVYMDILCHGVPSPLYLKKYVDYLKKKHNGEVVKMEFRNKDVLGWGSEHRTYYEIKKKNQIKGYRPLVPTYFSAFFWSLNLRPCCYNCKYTGINRIADITIGDFWGYWDYFKKKFPEGLSVVCINNQVGEDLYHKLEKNLDMNILLDNDVAMGTNTNFYHPTVKPKTRDAFYRGLQTKNYKQFMWRVYTDSTSRKKLMVTLYGRFMPNWVRKMRNKLKLG